MENETRQEALARIKAKIIAQSNKETKIKAIQFIGSPFRGEKWEALKAKVKAEKEEEKRRD